MALSAGADGDGVAAPAQWARPCLSPASLGSARYAAGWHAATLPRYALWRIRRREVAATTPASLSWPPSNIDSNGDQEGLLLWALLF